MPCSALPFWCPAFYPCVYLTGPQATLWCGPEGLFLAPCTGCSHLYSRLLSLLDLCCLFSGFFLGSFFCAHHVGRVPPHFPLCVCALSRGFLFLLLPSSPLARTTLLHWSSAVAAPLSSRHWSSRPHGAFPLAVPGQARCAPLPRVTLSPLSAQPQAPSRPAQPSPLLLLSCPVCAPLILTEPGLRLTRPHAPLCWRSILRPVGRIGRPPHTRYTRYGIEARHPIQYRRIQKIIGGGAHPQC